MTQAAESPEARLKRLQMRSDRRGIKEMDLILSAYAKTHLPLMNDDALSHYDTLLSENDQDLYLWVSGQADPPDQFRDLIAAIGRHARGQ